MIVLKTTFSFEKYADPILFVFICFIVFDFIFVCVKYYNKYKNFNLSFYNLLFRQLLVNVVTKTFLWVYRKLLLVNIFLKSSFNLKKQSAFWSCNVKYALALSKFSNTVKTVYNNHPWDLKKVAVGKRCLIKLGFRLAVDESNRPLLRGGRYDRFDCTVKLDYYKKLD